MSAIFYYTSRDCVGWTFLPTLIPSFQTQGWSSGVATLASANRILTNVFELVAKTLVRTQAMIKMTRRAMLHGFA
jgi:hypothetical protein